MTSVHRRPSLWSQLSFTRSRDNRASSISSQARPGDPADPFEKPDRHGSPMSAPGPAMPSSRWLKVAAFVTLAALAVFFLGPSGSREYAQEFVNEHRPASPNAPAALPKQPAAGGNAGQPADPALGAAKCSHSVAKDKPVVQYALMVDAGSTGSRIHVYRFNNCHDTPELEHEEFKMTKPGLSSFESDAEGAAKSLDVLLDVAMKDVPDALKACSPIAVKATAGLRLLDQKLGDGASKKILDAVRRRLETAYPFPVVAGDGVSIMDGKDEGVYAWITTNYLLGKIGSAEKTPTAAIFDLGGGSTQIVFEPTFPAVGGGMPAELAPGDHHYDLKFGGRDFSLYQHSHLGLGLMEARKAIHHEVVAGYLKAHGLQPDAAAPPLAIVNPCINVGQWRAVEVTVDGAAGPVAVKTNMTGPAEPAPAQCRFLAERILHKDAECATVPCSFNGVHQPSLERTFAREDVYIFSYFYDRLRPLGLPDAFTLREMADTAARVCAGAPGWAVFAAFDEALPELADRPEYCLDLSFMLALLHSGYELPVDREVRIAKKIKGNELGWCLGASLPLLEAGSGWQCRVKEVA